MLRINPTEAPIQLITATRTITIVPGEAEDVPGDFAKELRANPAGRALLDQLIPVDDEAKVADAIEAAKAKRLAIEATAKAQKDSDAQAKAEAEQAAAAEAKRVAELEAERKRAAAAEAELVELRKKLAALEAKPAKGKAKNDEKDDEAKDA